MVVFHETELVVGVALANAQAKLFDLRNANAVRIVFENRRSPEYRIILGRPSTRCAVLSYSLFQSLILYPRTCLLGALLTLQIRNVLSHLREIKRDISNRISLCQLVHQGAKLLKYLERTDGDSCGNWYERVLVRLRLEPGAAGELVV